VFSAVIHSYCNKRLPRNSTIFCLFLLLWTGFSPSVFGESLPDTEEPDKIIHIGVLAKRGKQQCLNRWEETASYLSDRISKPFDIRPLLFDEIEDAVRKKEVQFILSNPSLYIRFELRYGASRIATMINRHPDGRETDHFGGVVFCRADHHNLKKWSDLKGCRISAVARGSFGGWQAQLLKMRGNEIEPEDDFDTLEFEGNQDEVVYSVRDGRADAGCIRTGILEKMADEGKIRPGTFRILFPCSEEEKEGSCHFPHSTRLYPEWPFAMLPHSDKTLGRQVAIALMSMTPEETAAEKAGIAGWTIPGNYQPVRQLLKCLSLPPYPVNQGHDSIFEFIRQHYLLIILLILGIILAVSIFHRYSVLRLKLQQSIKLKNETEKSRAFLQRIIDAFPDQLLVIDRSHKIVLANRAVRNLLDDETSVTGAMRCHQVLHKVENCRIAEHGECPLDIVQETGKPITLEHSHLDPDGRTRIAKISASPIFDENGDVIQVVQSCADITDWRRSEADRRRLMSAIQDANEVVIITDIEGRIEYVNPAFEKVSGYSKSEALGKTPAILKSGEQDASFYKELWRTIESGKTWRGRIVNKRKDGGIFTEDASISPVRDSCGEIVNFVGVKRDISEVIWLEEQMRQARKMETVGRLAGGVAHDFNNMLGVILGHAELCISEMNLSHPLYDDLIQIKRAAEKSAELTKKLLAFARKQVVSPRILDLNLAIEETYRMLRRLIGEDIVLELEEGENLGLVKLDPVQVDLLMSNLCVNARDAITVGGKIRIRTCNLALPEKFHSLCGAHPTGLYVCLSVSDNGNGMDPDTLGHVFEPFFTTKEVGRGTGLGLATVYGIVKQNNGFIDIKSSPGNGTTFSLYFPRYTEETEVEGPEKKEEEGALGNLEIVTVLIVEDEPAILVLVERILAKLGCNTLSASTGKEALAIADNRQGEIDLLISDVVMPGIDGKELALRLRKKMPELKVLFVSGYSAEILAPLGILDSGTHLLQKPFSQDQLAKKLRGVLS